MGWCKFYQKQVDGDDSPDENDCLAPESLTIDVIGCQDCSCFAENQPSPKE